MHLPALFLLLACAPKLPVDNPTSVCESGFILDGSACVPESCGTGRWGPLSVGDDTVYVDVSAPDGGDGSEEAPFHLIQPAIDRAGSLGGALVAVAAGTYPESLAFTADHDGVRLAGRCRELVLLDASVGDEETPGISVDAGDAVIEVEGLRVAGSLETGITVASGDLTLRDSTISGSGYYGVYAWHPSDEGRTGLVVDNCLVEANARIGILAIHAQTGATIRDTTVKDSRPDASGQFGRGLEAYEGATLLAENCHIEHNADVGVIVFDEGTQVTLRDTTVTDTQPDTNGVDGRGIEVHDGAALSADGCLVDGNSGVGVLAAADGTQVTLRGTTVRDTRADLNGEYGWGIGVNDGAALVVESSLIEQGTDVGLYAFDPGTQVFLRDTIVRETRTGANGENGLGIEVTDGATLFAEGCLIERNTGLGLFVTDPGTEVTIVGTTLRETQPYPNGALGWGINVQEEATLHAEGCLIDGNSAVGLIAFDAGTHVTLRDTTVSDTLPTTLPESGIGIVIEFGATLAAEGCLIEGNTAVGLFVSMPGSVATLRDTTVKDTQPNMDGEYGRGVEVANGAILSAERCLIDGNTDDGLVVVDPGTRATIRDSTITGTKTGAGLMASTAIGANAQLGGYLSATRLAVRSNQGPGLLANGEGAVLECSECSIEGNQFAGAVAIQDGVLSISDSIIEGTTQSVNLLGGAGVYAWPWRKGPPTVILADTLIQDNPVAGVWLIGSGTFVITGNTIVGGVGEPFGSGSRCGDSILARDGVTAWDGVSGLLLQDNEFLDASGAGVFLDNSSAMMTGNSYSGNALDLVVQNQSCDAMPDGYAEAPQRDLCPTYSHPSCFEEFFFEAVPADPVE